MSLKDAYTFFLPLIFMAEMMMLSHSVIHAFLARTDTPTVALAAFSVAFSFHSALGSPIWAGPLIALAYARDRQAIWRLVVFNLRMLSVLMVIDFAVALTPLGDVFYGRVLGAGPVVAREARWATLAMFAVMPLVIFRSLATALIMINRRTILITLGTLIRLCGLAVWLWILPYWLEGAVMGAAAHTLAILVETTTMCVLARPYYLALPVQGEPPPRLMELWRFGWPLMLNYTAENSVTITINFFLGRLARADLALAAFGVANGLLRLLLSPLRNLAQTAQTLARTAEERRVLMRFTLHIVLVFTGVLAVLFWTPLRGWVLRSVMGLPEAISAYMVPGLLLSLATGFFWGYAALFRGMLAGWRHTTPIATASVVRLLVVVGVGLSVLVFPQGNGSVIGVIALTAAFVSDTVLLGLHLSDPSPG